MDEKKEKDKELDTKNVQNIEEKDLTKEETKAEINIESQEANEKSTKEEAQSVEVENEIQNSLIEIKKDKKKKKQRKPRKGSYILGTIGAVLGGLVATLPWILTYIFAQNLVIPVLATLIPVGAFLGYKIFGGKVKKGFGPIVSIISILIIVLITTMLCPTILMIQAEYEPTWENLKGLYSETREEIRQMIIEDLAIGLLFTIVGIVIVLKFIRKQVRNALGEEILKAEHQAKKEILKEQTQAIKNAFLNFNSTNQENAIKKKVIIKELREIFGLKRKKAKLYFKNTKINGILKKYKGKYYYDQENEEEKLENFKKIKKRLFPWVKFIITILLLAILSVVGIYIYSNMSREHAVSDSGISVYINHKEQDYYGTDEEITNAFNKQAAEYYDFILIDKANKYEMYGVAIPNLKYEDKEFDAIMQEDRDYWNKVLGEEMPISEVANKEFGDGTVKEYHYEYTSDSGKECRAIIYLVKGKLSYLWINVYTDSDVELNAVDEIIEKLLK